MSEVRGAFPAFMADPSLLMSTDGLAWLESDPVARGQLVIPWTFADLMRDRTDRDWSELVGPEEAGAPDLQVRLGSVEAMIDGIPRFSHRAATLAPPMEEVRSSLLLEPGKIGDLRADEWTFLQSQSVLLSKLRRPLEAFRDAGAVILELGRKTGIRLVERVIPPENLPEQFTRRVLGTAAIKWVALGGAAVGGGTLGGILGTAVAGPGAGVVGAKVGGFGAGAAANAALLAIDP